MALLYRKVAELAIYSEIALDDFILGKVLKLESEAILELKQWLESLPITLTYVGTDPIITLALESILSEFFHRPRYGDNSKLAPMLSEALSFFDFSDNEGARKLFRLCILISREFLNLEAQYYFPRHYCIVAQV